MKDKSALTQYPIHEFLRQRWSPLAFSDRAVEPAKLASLLEAARWAASCFNEQPWHFIVATQDNPTEFNRLLGCLVEANQVWAKKTPVLMITVASLKFARNGNPNPHAWHDVGLAVGNLTVQGMAMGLAVHQMGGFDPVQARTVYSIPEDYEAVTAIALGYPGVTEDLPENLQQRENAPRSRKDFAEFVFQGQWGNPSHLWPE